MSIPCCLATSVILTTGPTRMGLMMPSSAASQGPRSEVSSHGCTTTVVAGGTSFAKRPSPEPPSAETEWLLLPLAPHRTVLQPRATFSHPLGTAYPLRPSLL